VPGAHPYARLRTAAVFDDPGSILATRVVPMTNRSLADRLRLVRFELMLQRLPCWMVIALCDAIALANRGGAEHVLRWLARGIRLPVGPDRTAGEADCSIRHQIVPNLTPKRTPLDYRSRLSAA
jgi:hypothetical protein